MKYLAAKIILSFLFLFIACSDLDRTNPLDPKNSNSESSRFVLVEAFVNSSGGEPIEDALNGLARLYQDFSHDNFIILEHHIEKTAETDPDAIPESLNRYQALVTANTEQAIPDIFFDGLSARVQGASSEVTALNRYKIELQSQVLVTSYFTIEAEQSISGNQLATNATIARLGSQDAEDIVVQLIIVEKLDHKNIVRHYSSVKAVSTLKAGETLTAKKTVTVNNSWDESKLVSVIFVEDSRTKRILQTVVFEE